MRIPLRRLLLTGVAVLTTANLQGQQTAAAPSHPLSQEVDLAVTYTAQQSNLATGRLD